MRILIWSDVHLDASTAGMARFEDGRQAMNEVVAYATDKHTRCDAVVFAGDLCDPDAGTVVLRAVDAALQMVKSLLYSAVEVVMIPGNHDVVDDSHGRSTLTPLRVLDVGRATFAAELHLVETYPRIVQVGNADLLMLPYPPRTMRYDPAQAAEGVLMERLAGGGRGRPLLAIGHLQLEGAALGSETTDMARGADVPYPVEVLKAHGVAAMFNGHYHQRQEVQGVICPGSLERLRFDEASNRPGWAVVEV
jgi:DNA repair exonuclease SbcCD nuclease subunit